MSKSMAVRALDLLLVSGAALSIAIPQVRGQENVTAVSIAIDGIVDESLTPFVYVNGELAGAVGGVVQVPQMGESTIEVGLPQARQPLYSLKLGHKQFENRSVDVVMTSYGYENSHADGIWNNVVLKPNQVVDLQVKPAASGGYEITFPANPYSGYEDIIKRLGVDSSRGDWVETIPKANDASKTAGIAHLFGGTNRQDTWSGAYVTHTRLSWPPPAYDEREWKITSEPAGATIKTQLGNHGRTNQTISLPNLTETFVLLQMAGYVDCPHQSAECTLADTGSFIDLRCKLKKK